MKQTAVEWLLNEFQEVHKDFGGIDTNWIKRFDQAKAMEKEQIIKAFNEGFSTTQWDKITENKSEQYYKQIYKTK